MFDETFARVGQGLLLAGYPSLMQLRSKKYSMTRFSRLAVVAASALSLTACLVPEKFVASVRFKSDGAYVYKYEGSAVHFMAAAAIKQKGSLAAKDEEGLKRDAEKAAKAPGV